MNLDGLPLVDIGATALLALVVLMVLTDRLVTRRRLDDAERRVSEAERRAEKWERVALEAWTDVQKLTVAAEASAAVLPAIPIPRGSEDEGGKTDEVVP